MKLLSRLLGALAIMSCLAPTNLEAQAKIRIAIWDFENHSERSWWFYNDLGPAARNHIDTAFSENEALSSRFSVIEREKLDLVLKEQGLATSGALDQQTAAKVGRVLGIKYIITGAIDKFAINTTKAGFRGFGGSYTKAEERWRFRERRQPQSRERVGYRERSRREGVRESRRSVCQAQGVEKTRRGRRDGRHRR